MIHVTIVSFILSLPPMVRNHFIHVKDMHHDQKDHNWQKKLMQELNKIGLGIHIIMLSIIGIHIYALFTSRIHIMLLRCVMYLYFLSCFVSVDGVSPVVSSDFQNKMNKVAKVICKFVGLQEIGYKKRKVLLSTGKIHFPADLKTQTFSVEHVTCFPIHSSTNTHNRHHYYTNFVRVCVCFSSCLRLCVVVL